MQLRDFDVNLLITMEAIWTTRNVSNAAKTLNLAQSTVSAALNRLRLALDDELFIEARVKPRDIASVREGLDATVKLSAYDYTIYGSLKAKVTFISADTFKDERSRAPDGDPHYKVTLKVDRGQLTERQRKLEIKPGMQADVELETGGKTILTYLTKPLYRGSEALRER